MSTNEIVGPLGIWKFPILNRLLAALRTRGSTALSAVRALPPPQDVARAHNLETWEWTDYRGKDRKITVHREVEQTG